MDEEMRRRFDFADRFGAPDGEARNNSGAYKSWEDNNYCVSHTRDQGRFHYLHAVRFLTWAVLNGEVRMESFPAAIQRPARPPHPARRAVGTTSRNQNGLQLR